MTENETQPWWETFDEEQFDVPKLQDAYRDVERSLKRVQKTLKGLADEFNWDPGLFAVGIAGALDRWNATTQQVGAGRNRPEWQHVQNSLWRHLQATDELAAAKLLAELEAIAKEL